MYADDDGDSIVTMEMNVYCDVVVLQKPTDVSDMFTASIIITIALKMESEGAKWVLLAHDRNRWKVLVYTAMIHRAPKKKSWEFLHHLNNCQLLKKGFVIYRPLYYKVSGDCMDHMSTSLVL
jgi:hypothetical protein